MKIKDIQIFESNNNINVNVFSYDEKKVYTLRLSKMDNQEHVNIFFYEEHYGVVKDLSRLVSGQLSKNVHKKHICLRCLNHFRTPDDLEKHLELCQNHGHQRHVYPNNDTAYFKNTKNYIKSLLLCTPILNVLSNRLITKLGRGPSNTNNIRQAGFVIRSHAWTITFTNRKLCYARCKKKEKTSDGNL